jgi:transposase
MTRKTPPYPKEFRAEAVRLVLEQGLSLREASQRLAVAKGTLAGWVANARGANAQRAPGARSVAELENEVSGLRRELARTRMERDLLKKAAAYFAKESLHGTRS